MEFQGIEEKDYPVASIRDKRIDLQDGVQVVKYKVHWEGDWEDTWEPVGNLNGCRAKILAYERNAMKSVGSKPNAKYWTYVRGPLLPPGDPKITFWKDTDKKGLIKPLTSGSILETVKTRSKSRTVDDSSVYNEGDAECTMDEVDSEDNEKLSSFTSTPKHRGKLSKRKLNQLFPSDKRCKKDNSAQNFKITTTMNSEPASESSEKEKSPSMLSPLLKEILESPPLILPVLVNKNMEELTKTLKKITFICDGVSTPPSMLSPNQLDSPSNNLNQSDETVFLNTSAESLHQVPQDSYVKITEGDKNELDQKRQIAVHHLQHTLRILEQHVDVAKHSKRFPISYVLTEEEKCFLRSQLDDSILNKNVELLQHLLLTYRPCEMNFNHLYRDRTALMMLCSVDCNSNHSPCLLLEQMIINGGKIDEVSSDGTNALMIAAKNGMICKVQRLLFLGCRIDAMNSDEENALFLAIRHCPAERIVSTISLLLSNGIDIYGLNKDELSVFDLIIDLNKLPLIRIIKDQVQKFKNAFQCHVKKISPPLWEISSEILEFRYLPIETNLDWRLSFDVSELHLPQGFGGFLFLAAVEFNEEGVEFKNGADIPVTAAYFNNRILNPYHSGGMDILWLSPLVRGMNHLTITMIKSPKVKFQKNFTCFLLLLLENISAMK